MDSIYFISFFVTFISSGKEESLCHIHRREIFHITLKGEGKSRDVLIFILNSYEKGRVCILLHLQEEGKGRLFCHIHRIFSVPFIGKLKRRDLFYHIHRMW
jgi:hypothetical protein